VRRVLICLAMMCCLVSCSTEPSYAYREPVAGTGWVSGSLVDFGISPVRIAGMVDEVHDGGFESVRSILIVRDGRLVFGEYFHGASKYRAHYVASVTKSVTSILVGVAIDEGKIVGADQRVSDLLPQYADPLAADPAKMDLRLRRLLTMTSGLDWDEETVPYGTVGNACYEMEESLDAPAYVLQRSVTDEPGTRFQYCGGNPALLPAIVETATGRRVDVYADEVLFGPLASRTTPGGPTGTATLTPAVG